MVSRKKRMKRKERRARKKRILLYRSGLEDNVILDLQDKGIKFEYEAEKIKFTQPAKARTYNPDLRLMKKTGKYMYIEIKGKLDLETRQKHEWLKDQFPLLDLRFVFGNWNNKIRVGSPTSYRQWSEDLGILCANKLIPDEWLKELC